MITCSIRIRVLQGSSAPVPVIMRVSNNDVLDVRRIETVLQQSRDQFFNVPIEVGIDHDDPVGRVDRVYAGGLRSNEIQVVENLVRRKIPLFAWKRLEAFRIRTHDIRPLRLGTELFKHLREILIGLGVWRFRSDGSFRCGNMAQRSRILRIGIDGKADKN